MPYLTSSNLYGASLSPDELTIYFSNLSIGNGDMFVATRASKVDGFSNVTALPNLSGTTFTESFPSVTADGLTMFLDNGNSGDTNIHISTRSSLTASFSTPTAVPNINSNTFDNMPYVTPDGAHLYFASYRENLLYGIYRATRSNGVFGAAQAVAEVNDMQNSNPVVTPDELAIFVARAGGISVATRTSTSAPFGPFRDMPELAVANKATWPAWISADCSTLYLITNRDADLMKIWAAKRLP